MSNNSNSIAKTVILYLQGYLKSLGYTPVIHFELEGCYRSTSLVEEIDYKLINHSLKQLDIDGQLIPEYWHQQWEYVSLFNGQLPMKEADNLTRAMHYLPLLFAKQGIDETLIKPVVWNGDQGKLAEGCENVFSQNTRAVHIPNAIQMNVSVNDSSGKNIICDNYFGEYLQQSFLENSLTCSLLYLPEEEAFERFALKSKYGLRDELCSPSDISGGHQGSIALYKKLGKHNQAMGERILVVDRHNNTIVSESEWQKTARIEHRLGASSTQYNAYINVIFALLNIIDALDVYRSKRCKSLLNERMTRLALPLSLYCAKHSLGAIQLFEQEEWFANSIDQIIERQRIINGQSHSDFNLGKQLKNKILAHYRAAPISTGSMRTL